MKTAFAAPLAAGVLPTLVNAQAPSPIPAPAAIEWFDTPILLPSKLTDNRIDTARS